MGKQCGFHELPIKLGLVDNDCMTLLALRAVIMKYFNASKVDVIWSERHAEEALNKCLNSATRPDAILVDMDMDDIDGVTFCKRIRCYSDHIVLYAMTAHSLREYEGQARSCGAQALLDKADIKSLCNAIIGLVDNDLYIQDGFKGPHEASKNLMGRVYAEEGLSRREVEVLDLTINGLTAREVAKSMGLSESTVKTHIKKSIRKLGARNKFQLVKIWSQKRWNSELDIESCDI